MKFGNKLQVTGNQMKWKIPPVIKIYEALGAVADGRIEVGSGGGKVWSSSRDKTYVVKWDSVNKAIMTNDNGTYWQGYLGYPAVAFLMVIGVMNYDKEVADALKGIAWKEINTWFKNDFDKTIEFVLGLAEEKGMGRKRIEDEIERTLKQLDELELVWLGKKIRPPKSS